ncbi:Cation/H(+) antiporter 15 [Platanthera guangdongensis]|uniref:Cation/H(+) antiporter 15 n=1 Tax=Platanthera guangdongensis TaxID=2320717 RepID=A0ABR2LCX4_9ASPA
MEAVAVVVAGWTLPSPTAAAGKSPECKDSNVLILTVLFESILLVCSSQLLHRSILGRLGQPAAISQMLAGFLLGQSVLGQIKSRKIFDFEVKELSIVTDSSNIVRILFMFLIGLEIDIPYLLRAARRASFIVAGGMAAALLAAAALFEPFYLLTSWKNKYFLLFLSIFLIFSSSSSPVLARLAAELKLAHSEIGRLGVASALINDTACIFIVAAAVLLKTRRMITGLMSLVMLVVSTKLLWPVVAWINKRNEERKSTGDWQIWGLVMFVVAVAGVTEVAGYSSTMAGLVMGVAFPREGFVARTLVERLSYPVNNFILPVFYGFMGAQTDVRAIPWRQLAMAAAMVVVSSASKVAGTAVAARYLGMQVHEGVVLGFLLNIRGHVDLLIVASASKTAFWEERAWRLIMATVVCRMLLAAPMAAVAVKLKRCALSYRAVPLQQLLPAGELRFLLCVHGTRDVPTMLNLVEIASGNSTVESLVSLYLLHLIKLTNRVTNHMLYHQQEESGGLGWESGGDTRVIAAAGDVFRAETGINVHQASTVSSLDSMHVDIHTAADDVRASLLILPFHKHQRVDGRMQAGKKALRSINDLAMRHAPCTAGILVDRGLSATATSQAPAESSGGGGGFQTMHHVGVLFFGGGDDREALALGIRLSQHPCVAMTVVRFVLPPSSRDESAAKLRVESSEMDQDILLAFRLQDEEREADDTFFSDIFTRYVVSGKVAYMEKHVESGPETVTAICSIEGMFSLYLVGQGENRNSTLTAGMGEWGECPELGPVGDFLASSDFISTGSVLILKQCEQKTDEL